LHGGEGGFLHHFRLQPLGEFHPHRHRRRIGASSGRPGEKKPRPPQTDALRPQERLWWAFWRGRREQEGYPLPPPKLSLVSLQFAPFHGHRDCRMTFRHHVVTLGKVRPQSGHLRNASLPQA
jgi:hypothetical protein